MFVMSKGMPKDVERTARQMVTEKQAIAPLTITGGKPTFYVTNDKSLLRISFMRQEVDGTAYFVGLRK